MPKTYTQPVKIDGKEVGSYTFEGPASKAEMAQYGGTIPVKWTLVNGKTGTASFEMFDAAIYGAKLKAGAPVRIAAEAGVVKDHKLTVGKETIDLDVMAFEKACSLLNDLAGAVALGLPITDKNAAIVEHFRDGAVSSGKATLVDGKLVVAQAAPATPPKANGAKK